MHTEICVVKNVIEDSQYKGYEMIIFVLKVQKNLIINKNWLNALFIEYTCVERFFDVKTDNEKFSANMCDRCKEIG